MTSGVAELQAAMKVQLPAYMHNLRVHASAHSNFLCQAIASAGAFVRLARAACKPLSNTYSHGSQTISRMLVRKGFRVLLFEACVFVHPTGDEAG